MKLKELSHSENVAILTMYRLCGSGGAWRSQLHNAVGDTMTSRLLRDGLLHSKYVGGETLIFLSELGVAIAKSFDARLKENVTLS